MVLAIVLDDDMVMTMAMAMMMMMTARMIVVAGQPLVLSLLVSGFIPIGIDMESLRYGNEKLVAFLIPSSDLLPSPDLMD